MTEILLRTATTEVVRFDQREIDVLAVPYGIETNVTEADGRRYIESVEQGAFGNVSERAARIKVFRDHRPDRVVGRCRTLDGDRADGLAATVRIAPTPLGDETLALAAEGVLDVSIGFSPRAQQWSKDHSTVVRTSCWLHEISLVPLPAYETASVLAVRQEQESPRSATPNLDEIRDWLAELRYRQITTK